jgi:hypothetical protein
MQYDVDASWWVTEDADQHDYYRKLHRALAEWIASSFPFTTPYWSNAHLPLAE